MTYDMQRTYEPSCELCGKPVNVNDGRNYHRVEGWERPGKNGGSDIALRRKIAGRFAHAGCVYRAQHGVSPAQVTIEGQETLA